MVHLPGGQNPGPLFDAKPTLDGREKVTVLVSPSPREELSTIGGYTTRQVPGSQHLACKVMKAYLTRLNEFPYIVTELAGPNMTALRLAAYGMPPSSQPQLIVLR